MTFTSLHSDDLRQYLVTYIHSWVPFLSYEEMARRCRHLSEMMKNGPIEFVRDAMVRNI